MSVSEKANVELQIQSPNLVLRFAWMSLQADGSISVGVRDRHLEIAQLSSLDEAGSAVQIDLKQKHVPAALKNPHFTFHPASLLAHLTVSGEQSIAQWIFPADDHVERDGIAGWFQLRSGPVSTLGPAIPTRDPEAVVRNLKVDHENCSVLLSFDFVPRSHWQRGPSSLMYIDWHGRILRVSSRGCPPTHAAFAMTILH